jgi:hypothetical protein
MKIQLLKQKEGGYDFVTEADATHAMYQCPGCKSLHILALEGRVTKGPKWKWNGSTESPTFTPSVLSRSPRLKVAICHHYVTDGRIQFLPDCQHQMARQTVDMEDIDV